MQKYKNFYGLHIQTGWYKERQIYRKTDKHTEKQINRNVGKVAEIIFTDS